jgi:hypothetical protein
VSDPTGRTIAFELPNIQPWTFAGDISPEGTIVGVVSSAQGGLPITFRRASGGAR